MVSPWDANDKSLRWWYTVADAVAMEVNPSTGAIFTGPTRGSGYTEGTIWAVARDGSNVSSPICSVKIRPPVASVQIAPTLEFVLGIDGPHAALGVTIQPAIARQEVGWRSADPNVVTIDEQTGVITPVGVGSTIIGAYSTDGTGGDIGVVSNNCTVTVKPKPESFSFIAPPQTVTVGEWVGLPAAVLQPGGETSGPYWSAHRWAGSGPGIVDFNTNSGYFMVHSPGTYTIGVESTHPDLQNPQVRGMFTVQVLPAVAGIALTWPGRNPNAANPDYLNITVGQGVQLSAAVIPNDAIQDVVWEISPGSDGDNVSWNPQTRTITGLSVSSVPGTRWGIRAKSMDGLNTYSNWCWVQVLAAATPTPAPTASPTKKPTVTASPSPTATVKPAATATPSETLPPSAQINQDLSIIKSIAGAYYMQADIDEETDPDSANIDISPAADMPSDAGQPESWYIWRFEPAGNGRYYLYNMYHTDRVLVMDRSTSKLSFKPRSGVGSEAGWILELVSGNTYRIRNVYDPSKYLVAASSGASWVSTGASTHARAQWIITKYTNQLEWGGGVNLPNHDNRPYNVYCQPIGTGTGDGGSALSVRITEDLYKAAINSWNGISSNVNLLYLGPNESRTGKTVYIEFRNWDLQSLGHTTLGKAASTVNGVHYNPNSHFSHSVDDDFDSVTIYLNKKELHKMDDDNEIIAVIAHEIGHALKLAHNRDEEAGNPSNTQSENKSTFPSVMQNFVNSNGVNFWHAKERRSSWTITRLDRAALRKKWGE